MANFGFDQTRGCPITDARVCAVSAVDNSTLSCVSSQINGAFLVVAGIGSYVKLEAKWNNHTFAVAMPSNIEVDDKKAFDVTHPIYDVDIRNVETRTLRVGLVGGLCQVEG